MLETLQVGLRLHYLCLIPLMIETVNSVENVEDIAAVDGVGVLLIGSNDLLGSRQSRGTSRAVSLLSGL